MRLLFELDQKDYDSCTREYRRDSARAIIIRKGKVAMVHSLKYDYYKFPGGGIEAGESPAAAMIREAREEAGLVVIPESVREYGAVHRVQRSVEEPEVRFVQDNYYFLCEAEEESAAQDLDAYEAEESFQPEFVDPHVVIQTNRGKSSPFGRLMLEREARVLEMLIAEGLLH